MSRFVTAPAILPHAAAAAVGLLLTATAAVGQVDERSRPSGTLATWLGERGISLDSSVVLETARIVPGLDAVVVARAHTRYELPAEYRVVAVPTGRPDGVWEIDRFPQAWEGVGIEFASREQVIVWVRDHYGFRRFQQYFLDIEGRAATRLREFDSPQPTAVLLTPDTLFATYRSTGLGQFLIRMPLASHAATATPFFREEPVRDLVLVSDTLFVVTDEAELWRIGDGGWGGRERRFPTSQPRRGVRLLHPRLPQFRVVPGGLLEMRLTDTLFIPLDFPDREDYARAHPEHHEAWGDPEISVEIGPVTASDTRVWFGLRFYSGEGYDGLGGIGWFDPASRDAEILYLPELADWSVSTIAWDDGKVLVGRVAYVEGADGGGGGVGVYEVSTGQFRVLEVPGVVGAVAGAGQTIFALSDEGIFLLDVERVLRFRLIPGRGRTLQVVRAP